MSDQLEQLRNSPAGALAPLWAMARATQYAAASIATRPGADTDLRCTTAALHCGEAADELQRAHPNIAQLADIPDLATRLEVLETEDATDQLLAAIATALVAVDIDDARLQPDDMLAAATAGTWLALAHHVVSGRLP
jgi:hypothetical protein